MGKNERKWAELVEMRVAAAIDGDIKDATHGDIVAAEAIVAHIKKVHPDHAVIGATWVGREDYDAKGDVNVILDNGLIIPVELKTSKSGGEGTLGNWGTSKLHKNVDAEISDYPTYETENGYDAYRYEIVGDFLGKKVESRKEYENTLRSLKKTNKNHPVLLSVIECAAESKTHYAKYAGEMINKHIKKTNDWLLNEINVDDLVYCVIKNYGKDNVSAEFKDFNHIKVASAIAEGFSIKLLDLAGKTIIRFSVHWKNICQGGSTPCFNVFYG